MIENSEITMDITVAIPTYNGAQRLPILLERLCQQLNENGIDWEILVVDNNSSDNTAEVIQQCQADWSYPFALRYTFEPKQGAAFARIRAVKEANAELVGFLDDDNLPASNWLTAAVQFAAAYPQAGAFSGPIHGEYEVPPPEGFEKIKAYLAIRHHGSQPCRFVPEKLQLPPAASLVVRRSPWLAHIPSQPTLTGKTPGRFIQGDDYEPLLRLAKAGWEIWYNPGLQTYHQIPRQRFERDYLLTLAKGCGLATCQLRLITASPQEKPALIVRTMLGNLRRVIVHQWKHRNKLNKDLAIDFEMAYFWGSFLSPFYLSKSR